MKFFLRLMLLLLPCALLVRSTGCTKTFYQFYTNIPQGGYEIIDNGFKAGEAIGGLNAGVGAEDGADLSEYETRSRLYSAMGADAQLVVSADFSSDGAEENYSAFTKAVFNLLDNVSKALSPTVAQSDIYKFNNAPAGETIEISQITYEVLTTALDIYNLTDGCYNPALYYNVLAYGFGSAHDYPQNSAQLPADEDVAKYTFLAKSFGSVALEEADGIYTVTKPSASVEVGGETLSLKLDLGGIGKGYTVDCVDELFAVYGYKYGYFNFGSSSLLIKSNAQEGNYTLELINPRSNKREGYVRVPVRNEKLSTSGDNEQCYFIDGTRYCHIIDPETGKPVQSGIMSATVIGGGAAEADALTTAIMCMGKEKAIAFIEEKLTDRKVIFTVE